MSRETKTTKNGGILPFSQQCPGGIAEELLLYGALELPGFFLPPAWFFSSPVASLQILYIIQCQFLLLAAKEA